MSIDQFWSARRRIARAEKHIADLEPEIDAYFRTEPYSLVREINPAGNDTFHKIKLSDPLPDILTDITFDAISNLRASLDNAVYPIVLAYAPNRSEYAHFPISDTANSMLGRNATAFPPDIWALFCRFEPYEGGDGHLIWALNRIRRQAEHRLMVRCHFQSENRLIRHSLGSGGEFQFFSYVEGREDEVVFAISPIGTELNMRSKSPRL